MIMHNGCNELLVKLHYVGLFSHISLRPCGAFAVLKIVSIHLLDLSLHCGVMG